MRLGDDSRDNDGVRRTEGTSMELKCNRGAWIYSFAADVQVVRKYDPYDRRGVSFEANRRPLLQQAIAIYARRIRYARTRITRGSCERRRRAEPLITIDAKWEGLPAFQKKLRRAQARVAPVVRELMADVAKAGADGAAKGGAKAQRQRRTSGPAYEPFSTPRLAGWRARYYSTEQPRHLHHIRGAAKTAADRVVQREAPSVLRKILK